MVGEIKASMEEAAATDMTVLREQEEDVRCLAVYFFGNSN
jgi:hypothetical protein